MLREAEREEAGKVSISSSSWVQVGGGSAKEGVQRVRVNGNQAANRVEEEVEEEKKEEVEEPVKPPRLKKLARQQSKQELLRAKGFGQVIHPMMMMLLMMIMMVVMMMMMMIMMIMMMMMLWTGDPSNSINSSWASP